MSKIIDDQSKRMLRSVFFLLFLFVVYTSFALAGDIQVMVSGGFTAAYREIIPEFERTTHNTVATSRVDLARSKIGMAVRAGAPKPDISSEDRLTRALLNAKSIAYSASGSGIYLSTELFQRLGIAEQVLPKARGLKTKKASGQWSHGETLRSDSSRSASFFP